jgi:hypothetical protein
MFHENAVRVGFGRLSEHHLSLSQYKKQVLQPSPQHAPRDDFTLNDLDAFNTKPVIDFPIAYGVVSRSFDDIAGSGSSAWKWEVRDFLCKKKEVERIDRRTATPPGEGSVRTGHGQIVRVES